MKGILTNAAPSAAFIVDTVLEGKVESVHLKSEFRVEESAGAKLYLMANIFSGS